MKFKQLFLGLISVVLICFCFSIAQAQYGSSYLQRILSRGVLRVGVYGQDYPPFFMHNKKGKLTGADIALAKHIAEALGVKIKFFNHYKTYNDVVTAVAHNRVDLGISQLTITLNRAKKVRFTQPYTMMRQGVIVNKKELRRFAYSGPIIKAFNSSAVKLAVIKGSAYARLVHENFPKAQVLTFDNWANVMKAVEKGIALAGYYDEGGIKEYLLMHPKIRLRMKLVYLNYGIDRRAIVVAWNHSQLLYWCNLYLSDTHTDLTVNTAFKAYAGYFKRA